MALIKYYHLTSELWEEISNLDSNLEKYMLAEKHVKGLLTPNAETQGTTLDGLIYDSGEFDVMYRRLWTISKEQKRTFRKNIPPKYGIKLIVKALPEDILGLQDYLSNSEFEVIEARTISKATLSFATKPCHIDFPKFHEKSIKKIIEEEYSELKIDLNYFGSVTWDESKGACLVGTVHGEIIKILKFREFLKSSAESYGTKIIRESVTFA